MDSLSKYNLSKEAQGYHFGDVIEFPKEVTDNAKSVFISFGDKETSDMKISPEFFALGDNAVTVNIVTNSGEILSVDMVINVFAKNEEKELEYEVVAEYPHNKENFVQGFQLEGNIIYGSNGQQGRSAVIKYNLGSTNNIVETEMEEEYFGEGSTIVGDRLYQLTWQHKKGFVYDKNSLKQVEEFVYPKRVSEGWGLTYDGEHLILSDGTKNIHFLSLKDTRQIIKTISVAGSSSVYDKVNELEYHNGFIYANVWQRPYILKINPKNGEVVGKIDLSKVCQQHTTGVDDVLNGIAFKGENMLVTGKNWNKIYELKIQ